MYPLIFSYVFLGLSLAAPIGPINAAQLDKGIKNGFWHAWIFGWGAILADVFYMLLVYLGVVHFLQLPFIKTFLWLFGFFVLTYTGIECLAGAGRTEQLGRGRSQSLFSSFAAGFAMSISNPMTILFWLGIYGSILAKSAADSSQTEQLIYSAAVFIGIVIWDFAMALTASTFRRLLTPRILGIISFLSGLSLIGFGAYFGIQAVKELFFR